MIRTNRPLLVALVLAAAGASGAEQPKAAPTPTPSPHPGVTSAKAIVSPRDAATGQATGKRQHLPVRARYYDQSVKLGDGRVFLVNTKTGEVEFGDGTKGDTPPTGKIPADGTYRKGNGETITIHGGHTETVPLSPTKTSPR